MRRVSIVIPYLSTHPDHESAMRPLPDALRHVVEGGSVCKLAPLPAGATPEAAFLALDPHTVQVAPGPLTVAALGHHPPERSVHFHLTLCSVDAAGTLQPAQLEGRPLGMEGRPPGRPAGDAQERVPPWGRELSAVFDAVERLKTSTLTPLRGEDLDHALVWENGSTENRTVPPSDAYGTPYLQNAPQGEGEALLRRFIDDSVNLLNGLEANHVRVEDGLTPLNCLWPWGQGFRPELPNLPLRRGDVARVESGSMRMQGLCRLVGYAHGDRRAFGKRLQTDWDLVRRAVESNRISLIVLHSVEEMQRHRRTDEIAHALEQLSATVVAPLLADRLESPFELRIAAPSGHASVGGPPDTAAQTGLGLTFSSVSPGAGTAPLDERVLDDARVPTLHTWEHLHGGFLGES
ncbi:MAG: hypothetical protein WD716_09435 [Fimbriimonadaceae bacterium]